MKVRAHLAVIGLSALPLAHADQPFHFEEVTAAVGLDFSVSCNIGCAVAVGDYDDDGWEDLALIGRGNRGVRLYRNLGGTFVDVTETHLPSAPAAYGAVFVDLDNDGDQDLALARWHNAISSTSFFVLENRDGVFVRDFTSLAARPGKLAGLTVGDTDLDGLPEIVLLRPSHGSFVRNLGQLSFEDATDTAGVSLEREGGDLEAFWGAVLADFNGDRRPDLHIAIDYGPDVHARGNEDGLFDDVSDLAGVSNIGNDMGVAVGDIDNDDDLDIFSTNIVGHSLYVNDGDGLFTEAAGAHGCADPVGDQTRWGYGCLFADLDLDRDLDLVTVAVPGAGTLFRNDGTGVFATAEAEGDLCLQGYGLVAFDFDRDGDLDLLSTHKSIAPRLFRNLNGSGNWLKLDLRGRQGCRDGFGAKVWVQDPAGTQFREVLTGDSFYSSGSRLVHLGLGQAAVADEIRVRWPSGAGRTLSNVSANQLRTIWEPELRAGALLGDLDTNDAVDLADLLLLLAAFGAQNAAVDIDENGRVDLSDLAILLAQFGATLE